MKKLLWGCCALFAIPLASCSTVRNVTICCEPQRAAIYVDGTYQGSGIVNYSFPRKQKYIVVACSEDGETFMKRKFYTRSLPASINLYLSEYLSYSSGNETLSTH